MLVPGNYDGVGGDDFAVFRPSEGRWYVNDAASTPVTSWGINGDIPVPGDYNGDGDTDIAVYRPSEGRWYVSTTAHSFMTLGDPGATDVTSDRPEPGDYDGTTATTDRPSSGPRRTAGT